MLALSRVARRGEKRLHGNSPATRGKTVKRYLLVTLCLGIALVLWSQREGVPRPEIPANHGQSEAAPSTTQPAGFTAAAGKPAKRQAKGAKSEAPQIEISPAALQLGQATQALNLSYGVLAKFTAADVDYLNQCYRARTNPLDRMELTRVLAAIGNEETVQLFIHCLNEEQAGKVFKEQEAGIEQDPEFALWSTVTALGVLASKSDMAFEFLKRSVRPEYWNTAINWQSHRGDRSAGLMTDWAIQAVGNTGRREAREILTELLRNPPTPWPPSAPEARRRTFRSAIISAAFRLDYIEQYGQEVAKAGKGPDPRYAYPIWEKSEKGKVWLQK